MDLLYWYLVSIFFIIGTVTGSFLNCLIWRSYCGESVAAGRSYCPQCRHGLAWYDLVPVISFLLLKSRCRYCCKPILWQYPAVELAMGLAFVAAAWMFTPQIFLGVFSPLILARLLAYWLFFSSLAVIFVTDLRWYYIPDGATVAGIIGASIFTFLDAGGGYPWRFFDRDMAIGAFLSAVFAAAFFLAIFLVSRGKWLGFGDVKYAVLMGLASGFPGILVGMFFANFFGAILGLALVARGKKKMSSQVPFGPFLVAGTLVAIFFTDPIFSWYLSLTF